MFREAIRSIFANKLRSFLSMLGIVIGVAAVIAVVSVAEGTRQAIKENIIAIGSNVIMITPGFAGGRAGQTAVALSDLLTKDDAKEIAASCPSLSYVTPVHQGNFTIQYGRQNTMATVLAVEPSFFKMLKLNLAEGEFFTDEENLAARRVAVIGSDVANNLFPEGDAIGKTIRISSQRIRQTYTVIGVLEKSGNLLFLNPDRSVIVPFASADQRLFPRRYVSSIIAQASSEQLAQQAVSEIDSVLYSKFLDENKYRIISQEAMLQTLNQTMQLLAFMLGSIAGISLLVGGIGIMNIMLVSVAERTKEIGIRKAIGATNLHILLQFLIESSTLTTTAGGIGIAVGILISRFIAKLGSLRTAVTPGVILIAVSISIAVGIFFGVFPARRASKLNPVEALRYE
ncbi:ABC transporter permease [Pseudothermotoga thermarum]|nr:ABC transporter permease [Pseudothermotoga thermarum]